MPRHSKYRAIPTVVDDIRFASKGESNHYKVLQARERAGEISDLQLQPSFVLQDAFKDADGAKHRAIKYVADFQYVENGRVVIEDYKGMETPVFKMKAKMFRRKYPQLELRIVRR